MAVPAVWRPMAVPAVPVQAFGEGLTRVTKSQLHREIREAYLGFRLATCILFVYAAKSAAKRLQVDTKCTYMYRLV